MIFCSEFSQVKYINLSERVKVAKAVIILVSVFISTKQGSLQLVKVCVMYQEFVVCNIAGNGITNAENSTIFYFKSVSTWQEEPTAHVRSA